MRKDTINNLVKIVRKNYEQIADHYAETRKKQPWPELIEMAKDIQVGQKVLDIGCGSGRLLEVLQDKKITYIGIDPCEKLLENARKQYSGMNIEFRTGNILELGDFPEYNFDHVFSIAVLHHLPGTELRLNALRQLKNKIKQDGRLLITVWNLWDNKKYNRLIWKFLMLKFFGKNKMDFGDILFDWKDNTGKIISQRYYHAFTKHELKKLLKKAGLKIKSINKDEHNYYITATR